MRLIFAPICLLKNSLLRTVILWTLMIWGLISGLALQMVILYNWLWFDFYHTHGGVSLIFEWNPFVIEFETALLFFGMVGGLVLIAVILGHALQRDKYWIKPFLTTEG